MGRHYVLQRSDETAGRDAARHRWTSNEVTIFGPVRRGGANRRCEKKLKLCIGGAAALAITAVIIAASESSSGLCSCLPFDVTPRTPGRGGRGG